MKEKKLPVVIVGSAGSSKEIYFIIQKINASDADIEYEVLGFIEQNSQSPGLELFDQQRVIGTDDTMAELASDYPEIGVILPLANPKLKEALHQKYKKIPNAVFPNIIHPSAIFEGDCQMGIGNIISAGCVLACDLKIGNFNLLNRCCTTGHDVRFGDYNTVNPSVVISGNVTVKDRCLMGVGCIVLQGLIVERDAVLGAGAVLTKNADQGETLVGIPAAKLNK